MAADLTVTYDRLAEKSVTGNYSTYVSAGIALAAIGAVLFAMALMNEGAHRAWQAFHVNWVFWTGLTGGSIAITAAYKIANAKWSGVILRLSQAVSSFIPVVFVGLALIMTVGYHDIYGHMNEELHGLSHGKAMWLSRPWMATRLFVGLGLLFWLGTKLIRCDLLPDLHAAKDKVTGARKAKYDALLVGFDAEETFQKTYRIAPMYAATYALVFTMVAFDGMMALQPHWFSNLLGGWFFMGSFLGGHMLMALNMLYSRKAVGLDEYISAKQRHDLGKLCFGFTVFWTYLMWAQFLVIWYGNLPEETGFVFARLWGDWRNVGVAVFLGMFVIPFTGFLGVGPKKTPITMAILATVSLSALWLERYLMITPSITAEAGPVFGLPELGPMALFLGLFLLLYGRWAQTWPMVSPRMAVVTLEREAGHGH